MLLDWKLIKTDTEKSYHAYIVGYHFEVYEDKEDEFADTYVAEINGEEFYRGALGECSAYCDGYAEALDLNQ